MQPRDQVILYRAGGVSGQEPRTTAPRSWWTDEELLCTALPAEAETGLHNDLLRVWTRARCTWAVLRVRLLPAACDVRASGPPSAHRP